MNIDYEYERYIADKNNVLSVLEYYGVAIIPSILDNEECDKMNIGIWNTLEHSTSKYNIPIDRNKPETWREIQKLYPKHSMLIQNWDLGHAQYIWDIRQNPKIVEVYANIWKCKPEDLLVSFDALSYHMPPETTNIGWYKGKDWLHSDQSYLNSDFKSIQSWVTGYDVNEGDASLLILESSHDYHEDFQNKFKTTENNDWYKLEGDKLDFYKEDKCCLPKRIKCPKGSMVLWDSRTIHCGSEAIQTRKTPNFRNVVYVCYEPRNKCLKKNLLKKQEAFNNMRVTSHWPCKVKLFPKKPHTYGAPIYELEPLPAPKLTELGRRLAGF